ncbi:acyltransferase-like protein [Xylariaceae sp. FL0804]|nr:acyltransferase-like protein [Xylariaceae sp. FL0804]
MEKYSQFRDKGSGISPFMPVTSEASWAATALHAVLFAFRLPLFLLAAAAYFCVLGPLSESPLLGGLLVPAVARKLLLWALLGIPGIWWVDLRLDGVKRGAAAAQPRGRFPRGGSVLAAQSTSPVDALYLAAVFDPVFAQSFPGTARVQHVSLLNAVLRALAPPALLPDVDPRQLTTLRALAARYPDRPVAVFPEMTPTNGRGVLPFSPSLLGARRGAPVFPVSVRYAPADITTPVPRAYARFLWSLLGRPTHALRVRIAEAIPNDAADADNADADADLDTAHAPGEGGDLTPGEQRVLDRVAEALARLARNKRIGLTLQDKVAFIHAWNKAKK